MSSSQSFTSTIPKGKTTTIRIIDSTSEITKLPWKALMEPPLPGFEDMPALPTWSFLIEHESGRKVLFDLGIPVDWEDMAAPVAKRLTSNGWGIKVDKPTTEILTAEGVDPASIEAIVWSHWHWDHIGNPSHFPSSTKVIVGPGFKDELLPAYPAGKDSPVRESDFAGRELHEVSFTEGPNTLKIGPFPALDYFGDGSFYLLDTPGHTTGHISGLARTTTGPDTFIFMGGDLTHHGGELRPSPLQPLPDSLSLTQVPGLEQALRQFAADSSACPGAIFESLQELPDRKRTPGKTTPFFDPTIGKDVKVAIETIRKTMEADADANVLYIFAHDTKLREVVGTEGFFPRTANHWQQAGWREALLWRFLEDFEVAVSKQLQAHSQGQQQGGKL